MGAKWQRFAVDVPKSLKPADRVALAKDIIDHIYQRSKQGKNINNRQFKEYTEKYAKRKGSAVNDVNLILRDKMLKSMQLLSQKSGRILIGYVNGTDENNKADGNHRGTYGTSTPKKPRPFVGITKKDLNMLIRKHKDRMSEETAEDAE